MRSSLVAKPVQSLHRSSPCRLQESGSQLAELESVFLQPVESVLVFLQLVELELDYLALGCRKLPPDRSRLRCSRQRAERCKRRGQGWQSRLTPEYCSERDP